MSVQDTVKRFQSKKWGVFYHFLGGHDGAAWNERVKRVDVNLWAEQLHELGCGFMGITLMQVTKCMLAPNQAYNRITGYKNGEACAERDFVLELSDALAKYDIDLMLYFTGDGPCRDPQASDAFGFKTNTPRCVDGKWDPLIATPEFIPESFVDKWSEVIAEYSNRYGKRIFAWWFDGCYESIYHPSTRLSYLERYKNAARSGNPDALLTFNPGFSNEGHLPPCALDDFTSGETSELLPVPKDPYEDGALWFEFLCNGFWWKNGDRSTGIWVGTDAEKDAVRYTPEELRDHVKAVSDAGGVVMFDTQFVNDGKINPLQFEAMSKLKELVK